MYAALEELCFQFLSGGRDNFPKAVLPIVGRRNKSDLTHSLNFISNFMLLPSCILLTNAFHMLCVR